ncbi:MAG: acylneuraminate cytidylyltransferase [Candidatus Omnitrophica bacterium]|nr:acylneuraminate cytidylyltransferase [Candidatus Omnitrophota bacterium]
MTQIQDKKRVIAIIPARGGSKSIPQKNIFSFCGKPLLAWSIEQAKQSECVGEVYVSTNDAGIAQVAQAYGAQIIWRPEELSGDTASSETAIEHALQQIEQTQKVDLVVFLQATSPVRLKTDIDLAMRHFHALQADSLFSAAEVTDFCLWKKADDRFESFSFDYQARGQRQTRPPLYLENGSIYIFSPGALRQYHNRLGGKITAFLMPRERSFEIDTAEDIPVCAHFLRRMLAASQPAVTARDVDLLVYDFDGVMTDNKVIVQQDGLEAVAANRGDGLAVALLKKQGWRQMIVSTETNPVVAKRAQKIEIPVYQSVGDKKQWVMDYCAREKIDLSRVLYVGNDLNDLAVMSVVGWPACPLDAHPVVKDSARIVLNRRGGDGVIRALYDVLNSKKE